MPTGRTSSTVRPSKRAASKVEKTSGLGGTMVAVQKAPTAGIDSSHRPYTRDGSGAHIYHYTFDFKSGFTHFFLNSFVSKANASGSYTSDTCYSNANSTWKSWTKGNNSNHGDVAFGPTSAPLTSLCKEGFTRKQ